MHMERGVAEATASSETVKPNLRKGGSTSHVDVRGGLVLQARQGEGHSHATAVSKQSNDPCAGGGRRDGTGHLLRAAQVRASSVARERDGVPGGDKRRHSVHCEVAAMGHKRGRGR